MSERSEKENGNLLRLRLPSSAGFFFFFFSSSIFFFFFIIIIIFFRSFVGFCSFLSVCANRQGPFLVIRRSLGIVILFLFHSHSLPLSLSLSLLFIHPLAPLVERTTMENDVDVVLEMFSFDGRCVGRWVWLLVERMLSFSFS